ncbi:hypothetical protein SELMODRAFT_414905 [Selaginella moellendorffii]|uniref:Uncharacterized protein n=1 Tax=Selaginella moellendorffii TaxID=88036 RepID=D8RTY9_SELML|nr:hypothetical protein SELMODRAFT_414905 [Selaginella moellendorffii]
MEAVLCADKSPNHSRGSIYRFATNTSQRGAGTGTSFIWDLFIGQWREHYLRWMKKGMVLVPFPCVARIAHSIAKTAASLAATLGDKAESGASGRGEDGKGQESVCKEERKEEAIKCWPFQTGRDQPFEDKEHRALTGVHWNADSNFRKKNHANCSQNHPSRGIKIDLKRRVSFGVAVVPCTVCARYMPVRVWRDIANCSRPAIQPGGLLNKPEVCLENFENHDANSSFVFVDIENSQQRGSGGSRATPFSCQNGLPKVQDIQERFVVPTVTDARHKHQRCCEEETHSQPPGEGRPLANSGKAGCCQVILSTSPRFIRAGISYCQQLSGEPRLWDSTAQTATEG